MEHVELAGIHSGDSACSIPPRTLSPAVCNQIRSYTHALAKELNVIGLMNVQYAVQKDVVYIIEVNPRASRTVPYVSKAIGVPLARLAALVMAGKTLKELGFTQEVKIRHYAFKEAVLPFNRFPAATSCSRPKCTPPARSWASIPTRMAYVKSQLGAGNPLPLSGRSSSASPTTDKAETLRHGPRTGRAWLHHLRPPRHGHGHPRGRRQGACGLSASPKGVRMRST
jgi:carbamoyl-phosphate synthase large subunit